MAEPLERLKIELATARPTVFISYNQADRAWAEWIAWMLEENGYKAVIQAWDIQTGSNFVLEMDKAAAETDRTSSSSRTAICARNSLSLNGPRRSRAIREAETGS